MFSLGQIQSNQGGITTLSKDKKSQDPTPKKENTLNTAPNSDSQIYTLTYQK
jgi:hypothetical protein